MRFSQEQQVTMNEEYINMLERNTNTGNLNIEQFTTNLFDESLLDREVNELFNNVNNDNGLDEEIELIRILAWNASGLSNNLDRLITRMKRDGIMFAIVTESWYHPERHIPSICIFNSLAREGFLGRSFTGLPFAFFPFPDLQIARNLRN